MNRYTVEVTTEPVVDHGWAVLRRIVDLVPGTLLIEDAEAPVLVVPVDSESPMRAALFVDGITKLTQLVVVSGKVYPAPDANFDLDEEPTGHTEVTSSPVVDAVHHWIAGISGISGHVTTDGRLVNS